MILEFVDIFSNDRAAAHVDLPPDARLRDIFEHEKLRSVVSHVESVTLNGTPLSNWRDVRPRRGDHVVVSLAPRDFFIGETAAIIAAAVSIVTSIIRLIVSLVTKPPQPKERMPGSQESPTYAFDGMQTSIEAGRPVPVIYGTNATGGQVLGYAIDVVSNGTAQIMSLLLGVGEGPIREIGSVTINATALDNFPDIQTDYRLGDSSQSVLGGYEQIRNTFSDGRQISTPAIVYTTHGFEVDKLDIQVAALTGLYFTKARDGFRVDNTVYYSIETKPTAAPSYTIVVSPVQFVGQTQSELWNSNRIDCSTRTQWDLRLRWLNTDFHTAGNDQETFIFNQVKGAAQSDIWLKNVTEITERTESFSSTALYSIKGIATAQLQGGRPNVVMVVKGRAVNIYNADLTTVDSIGPTDNPAWCILDYLTNSVYGMGAFISQDNIDMQSFYDFSVYCNSLVPDGLGGLEKQHTLNICLDFKKPHWEHVHAMLANYRSSIIYSNGKYRVITDRDAPVRQVFHAGNIIPERTVLRIGTDIKKPNQINCDFANEKLTYTRDLMPIYDPISFAAGDPIVDYDVSFLGMTRESEVLREGSYQLARRRGVRRTAQWVTGLEGISVEPGDLAQFGFITTHYQAGFGGRALGGDVNYLIADREITYTDARTYEMYVWHTLTDTAERRIVIPDPGMRATISVTSNFAQAIVKGDRYAIGVQSLDTFKVRLSRVSRTQDGMHELTGEEFVPLTVVTPSLISSGTFYGLNEPPPQFTAVVLTEIAHMANDGNVISSIKVDFATPGPVEGGFVYGATINTPGYSLLSAVGGYSQTFANGVKNERMKFTTGSGYGIPQQIVATTEVAGPVVPPLPSVYLVVAPGFSSATLPHSGDFYAIEHRKGLYSYAEVYRRPYPSSAGMVPAQIVGLSGTLENMPQSGTFIYQFIPVSDRGIRNTNGVWLRSISLYGDRTLPENITEYSVRQINGNALHTWRGADDADLSHYEIRDGQTWETAALVVSNITQTFFEMTDFVPGQHNFLIKAQDFSGNQSSNSAPFAVVLQENEQRQHYLVRDELVTLSGSLNGLTTTNIGTAGNFAYHGSDFTQPTWAKSGNVTITSSVFLDPFRNFAANLIDFSSNVGTASVSQITALGAQSQDVCFSIWLKSAQRKATVNLRLHGMSGAQESNSVLSGMNSAGIVRTFEVGPSWKQYVLAWQFSSIHTGPIGIKIEDTDNHPQIYASKVQVDLGTTFSQAVTTGNSPPFYQTRVGLRITSPAATGAYAFVAGSFGIALPMRYTIEYRHYGQNFVQRKLSTPVKFDEKHSLNGRDFTSYVPAGAGDIQAQQLIMKTTITAPKSGDTPIVDMLRIYQDAEVKTIGARTYIGSDGIQVNFSPPFLDTPEVTITVQTPTYYFLAFNNSAAAIQLFQATDATLKTDGTIFYSARGI